MARLSPLTLRLVFAALVCRGLMSVALPLQPCLFITDQPVTAVGLRLYLACLGVQRQEVEPEAAERFEKWYVGS